MPALVDYRLQIIPSATNADQYEIDTLSSDGLQTIEYKPGSQKHQWSSLSGTTAGTPTPPPINNATSTNPLAYASANQIRVLEQALPSGGSVTPAGLFTLTERSGSPILPGIDLSPLKTTVVDALNSTSATSALSANQGKILNDANINTVAIVGSNIVFTLKGGATKTLDITALQLDVKMVSAAYVSATKRINFTLSDGTIIPIDAAALLPVSTDGVTISGDGSVTPLAVRISPDAGNALVASANGLKVTIPAPTPTTVSNAIAGLGLTRTLTTTVNGVTSTPQPIPDTNDNVLTIGGTAAAPTISNGGAAVALPSVPPTSNALAITKAAGAVSTVQGVAATQAIPAGTIVETLGYNAAGAPVYQAIATSAPQTADNGLTKTANNTQLGGTLLGATTITTSPVNTLAITGLVTNTAPTDLVTRDAAGKLTQSTLASVAPNVTFGTVAPAIAPTTKKGDEYYVTSTGTSTGAIQSRWIYDGTVWVNTATTVPDDIINVSGATLPITFPVATIPGTPVFVPATPTNTTAIYAITNGTAIQYAKWNGTQYISAPAPLTPNVRYGIPAPTVIAGTDKKNDTYIQTVDGTSAGAVIAEWVFDGTIWKNVTVASGGHFRSGTGTTAPDGVADPTENISRPGKTGFGVIDPSTLLSTLDVFGSFGVNIVQTSTAAYAVTDTDHTIYLLGLNQAITLPTPATATRRILVIANPSNTPASTNLAYSNIATGLATTAIPAFSTVMIQSTGGAWRQVNNTPATADSRFSPTALVNGVAVGGTIPGAAQIFNIQDGDYSATLTLPAITSASEALTIVSRASLSATIATTNQIAGALAQTINAGQSLTFVPSMAGWVLQNASLVNGGTRYQQRGTFAAPLTGAISLNPEDELLYIATGSTTTLPAPASFLGRRLNIKKPGIGIASIVGSVDGVANLSVAQANESVTLHSDGATWTRI